MKDPSDDILICSRVLPKALEGTETVKRECYTCGAEVFASPQGVKLAEERDLEFCCPDCATFGPDGGTWEIPDEMAEAYKELTGEDIWDLVDGLTPADVARFMAKYERGER